jgi:site-specific DNA recombinase
VDLGELVDVCKRNNTQIATVKAGTIDLTTPTGRLVAGLLAQVATYEGEAKSDRWKRSVRQRREAGTFAPSGPRMYGWTRDGEIVESEADNIRWMAQQIVDGTSMTGLTREAMARGIETSLGAVFRKQSIKALLLNPKLAGYSTLNGDIIGEGNWAPILDRETWETVRATIAANPRKAPAPRVALLVGLIFCGKCGAKMVTGSRTMKPAGTRGTQRTYRCTREPGEHGCRGVSGAAEPIEEIVESYTRALLDDPRIRARIAALRSAPTNLQGEVAELELRITELEQQLDEPGVPVPTILRAIDRAKEKQAGLLSQIAATTPVVLPAGREWPTDLRRRRALVDLVVERVTLAVSVTPGRFDPARVRIQQRN